MVPAFLAAYAIVMTVAVWLTQTPRTIPELGFGFGTMAAQIAGGDLAPSAHRPPLIPWFLGFFAAFDSGTLLPLVVKSVLTQGLLLWVVLKLVPRRYGLRTALFVLTFPQLTAHAYALVPEEGWLIPWLAFLFYHLVCDPSILTRRRLLLLGLVLAAVLLTKSSMRLLCPVLALLLVVRAGSRTAGVILGAACLAAFLAWGSYNYAATGKFRFGSSLDGYNLYKGNNPRAAEVYPARSLDALSPEVAAAVDWSDEWQANDIYVRLAHDFWKEEPATAVRLFFLRVYRMFIAVTPVDLKDGSPVHHFLHGIGVVYMLVFRLVFLGCVTRAVLCMVRPRASRPVFASVAFLVFTLAYSTPYLFAFAYERHALVLVVPTLLYALTARPWCSCACAKRSSITRETARPSIIEVHIPVCLLAGRTRVR